MSKRCIGLSIGGLPSLVWCSRPFVSVYPISSDYHVFLSYKRLIIVEVNTMILRKSDLIGIIREEIEKFKSEYESKKHLDDQASEYQRQRKARDDSYPESLRSFARGVLESNEAEDQSYVKIRKSALDRLLAELEEPVITESDDVAKVCNSKGFYRLAHFLKIQSAYSDAEKGKFTKDVKQ